MRLAGFLSIIQKDWQEYKRPILLITAGMFIPVLITVTQPHRSPDFAKGMVMGILAGGAFAFSQSCFLNERQGGTLNLLLSLPVRPSSVILAKYASLYSMVLFSINIPALLVPNLKLILFVNVVTLFVGTVFMASTVIWDQPWAAQIPLWILLIFFLPTEQLLRRWFPGLVITVHPTTLGVLAVLLIPVVISLSIIFFNHRDRRRGDD